MLFPVEIYAEINKKQLLAIENGDEVFFVPMDVVLKRKQNSRACYFTCANESALDELKIELDASGISWQEN